MSEKINEKLSEADGLLENEAMLKGVAGGFGSSVPDKACPECGRVNSGLNIMGLISYNCSNHDTIITYH